ncbi:MAG: hypothetical protein ABSG59_12395 [Verrucomicrobiota bacterium]|jgi:hypothetical protein
MNLLEIIEIRDRLKAELETVEKFLEIAKNHGANGSATIAPPAVTGADAPPKAAIRVPNRPTLPQRELPGIERKYGELAETVEGAIKLAPARYTIANLFEILQKIGKPLEKKQISTVLMRMAKKEKILVHRRGKGSRPTIFKNVSETVEQV